MTVRVGFIGVGGMAEHHIITLQRIEHAQITAVYDINQVRSKEVAEKYGAKSYESSAELIDSGEVDALFVCTPPFARSGAEEAAAARKGIHLLAEKPVGLHMEEVRKLEQIIRDSGIIHTSGYCLRYLETAARAKAYLADKQIDMVLSYRLGGMPGVRWWRMMEQSGGQLVEQSTHQLDLIRYLAGEIKEVHAIHEQRYIHNIDPEATAYDVGTVSFVMESGAIGNITSSCLSKYVGKGGTEFYGHNFFLSIDGNTLRIVDDNQDLTEVLDVDFYYEQDKAFIEAIRTNQPGLLLGDFSDAADTLAVTLAANESAASGKSVAINNVKERSL
ncbi:Gfo/Idh/MocA family protein [Paenibacillus spongiae]|uniref:Gfo/Idh/MocA family oxidoreductase n=1 Tax=Paenibacillus spongiae TaxID=2909671 RepID=A0ABY5SF02_9BACL|nr:Gfo/Idh/MocA family oxidoreductase [Paenibacillus spongiae]UVI31080.1 Gfo/Idh/MocA family oxidoreductase [Paenibacillus spongiae]